jgi:uncharacterized protein (TIGR02594 family)
MTDLLLEFLSHYGLKEIDGPESNPDIIAMFKEIGYDVQDDSTTAWCSAAMNYYAKKTGYEYTGKLDARSWLKTSIIILKPTMGDIVVFWRDKPSGWEGHVGLFIAWDETNIYTLGGNESNMIKISPYPRAQLLGFRQLKKII